MKRFFKSFFGASSKEVNGVTLLVIIFLMTLIYPSFQRYLSSGNTPVSSEDAMILDSLVAFYTQQNQKPTIKFEKFNFNPNTVTVEELLLLGFNDRTAGQIINYRSKGGQFRIKKDLYKIYSIDSVLVDSLYQYIDLPETETRTRATTIVRAVPEIDVSEHGISSMPATVDRFKLNSADTAMLQTVNGIGSVLSNRIITFRDKLGGFASTDQLYEVYNLDSTVVNKLLEVAYLDTAFEISKLEINLLKEEDLAHHPYISKKQARLIVAYRNQHGQFNTEQDLLEVYLVNESDLNRLRAYLVFN